jgi:hypothetical protein
MPHGRARRPPPAVRGLRAGRALLQLLPRSALPQVPGAGRSALGRGPTEGSSFSDAGAAGTAPAVAGSAAPRPLPDVCARPPISTRNRASSEAKSSRLTVAYALLHLHDALHDCGRVAHGPSS